jgi:ABC-type phosphate/phosphonate transport system permease subunit
LLREVCQSNHRQGHQEVEHVERKFWFPHLHTLGIACFISLLGLLLILAIYFFFVHVVVSKCHSAVKANQHGPHAKHQVKGATEPKSNELTAVVECVPD